MNPIRYSMARGLLAVFAVVWSSSQATAGDVTGSVTDSSNRGALPGAVVSIAEVNRSTTTDSAGNYTLSGLPAGTYAVQVRYLGYDNKTETVTVPESGSVALDVRLGDDIVNLETFRVGGYREGRSRALQQKQNQTNISDIISADAIGNLPDRNVAEAISRLPGVNMSLEQGEGRYVSIRGVEPNLNQVLIDGAVAAAPGGTRLGRAVPLDTLGTGQISTIEVIKSVTPDLDANSLGGTVNIKTGSAFDHKGRRVTGSAAVNHNVSADKNNVEGRLSFSDTFGPDKKWGISAGASYDKRDYENHWLQVGGWNRRTYGTFGDLYMPSALEIKPEFGNQERWGGNISLEFRPDKDTQFYFRPNFSATEKRERTLEMILSVDNAVARTALTSATTGTFAAAGYRPERRDFESKRTQDLLSLVGGFKKILGDFTVEGMISHSKAEENRVFDRILAFRPSGGVSGPVSFDIGSFAFNRWDVDYNLDVPANYSLRRTRDDNGVVDEVTSTAKIDVQWDTDNFLGQRGFFKTGFKFTDRSRITDLESYRLVPVGSWRLNAIGVLPAIPVYDGRFTSGFRIDPDATWKYIADNPALTVYDPNDSIPNSIEDDYDIDEYIYAGYGMGSVTINRLTLLGGVRWEKTDATIRAVEVRQQGGTILGRFPTSGSTSYDKFFPNLQAVYRFNDRLLARAAFTQTIGRPAYEDTRPLSNFRYDPLGAAALDPAFPFSGTLSIGNPDLKPFDATNLDLSIEWYSPGGGLISAALFRKQVDDPIYSYSETQQRVVHSGISLETLSLTSRRNANSGHINGIELNVYQPFRFLPAPFDGFGIDANITRISSGVTVPTRPGEDFLFFRQPSNIRNVTLFYEKNRFSARLSYNYSDEQLYSLGSVILSDIYRLPREQYDAQFRFRINSNYSITASVRNLTREKEEFSYGVQSLMRTTRLLDRDYKISVDFNF
jgi:TonB-dependent receptor